MAGDQKLFTSAASNGVREAKGLSHNRNPRTLRRFMFLSNGVLKYFTLEGVENNTGWLILQCDLDLILYYCWFLQRRFGIKLQRPLHGSHITVVRGEVIKSLEKWNAYQGNLINFHYSNEICTNRKPWWLDVYSPCLISIRQELGLEPQPKYDLHLTIGVLI